jgi:hypothetical protein
MIIIFFFILLFSSPLQANETYPYNPYVPLEVWEELEPYFLPAHHPIKSKLDRLFKSERVIASKESFESAGFAKVHLRQPTNIVVGKHPRLEGYLIKAYLDNQPLHGEWQNWLRRIHGAQAIRANLRKHHFKQFKVPHKWIYPVPFQSHLSSSAKHFILVVEDMRILSAADNLKAYRKKMTPELLDALYVILTEEGLIDSVYPDNIPFTKDGHIAFIDTEHHHVWPIKYDRLTPFLSKSMQNYWQKKTSNY